MSFVNKAPDPGVGENIKMVLTAYGKDFMSLGFHLLLTFQSNDKLLLESKENKIVKPPVLYLAFRLSSYQ